MEPVIEKINSFFAEYENIFNRSITNTPDVDAIVQVFADRFIEASPLGVHCGTNDDTFREVIPKGYAFYKSIGTTSMKITAQQTTSLNEWHYMTRVAWHAVCKKKDGKEVAIDFEVIYFTQYLNEQLKIFAYITGDEQKVLREKGLVH